MSRATGTGGPVQPPSPSCAEMASSFRSCRASPNLVGAGSGGSNETGKANAGAEDRQGLAEAGGDLAEFKAESDPSELEIRSLLKQYQDLKNEHNKKIDEIKEINLKVQVLFNVC